jgi:DNA gyrase subunit A
MLITVGGQMVRIAVKDIREAGRNTQGVKLIELAETDELQAIARVISEDKGDQEANGESAAELPAPQASSAPPTPTSGEPPRSEGSDGA